MPTQLREPNTTMPKVRGNPVDKWVRKAAASGQDYQAGVENPRTDWASATAAAAPVQAQAVQEAIRRNAFAQGVAKAGNQRWQSKSVSKGVARYGPGVADAAQDYAQGVAPYLQVIEQTKLPARGPRGDARNYERVRVMGEALRNAKLKNIGR